VHSTIHFVKITDYIPYIRPLYWIHVHAPQRQIKAISNLFVPKWRDLHWFTPSVLPSSKYLAFFHQIKNGTRIISAYNLHMNTDHKTLSTTQRTISQFSTAWGPRKWVPSRRQRLLCPNHSKVPRNESKNWSFFAIWHHNAIPHMVHKFQGRGWEERHRIRMDEGWEENRRVNRVCLLPYLKEGSDQGEQEIQIWWVRKLKYHHKFF